MIKTMLLYVLPALFLLFIYCGIFQVYIRFETYKNRRVLLILLVVVIIGFAAFLSKKSYEDTKLNVAVNSEYSLCLSWKSQMEIIKNRCHYSNSDCSVQLDLLRKKFEDRKERKQNLYKRKNNGEIKNLSNLKNCASDIGGIK